MDDAIGLIETIGVAASFAVADVMVKAADVRIMNQETTDAALITITIRGDLSSVHAAMAAGRTFAEQTGVLFSCCILGAPNKDLTTMVMKKEKNTYQTILPKER